MSAQDLESARVDALPRCWCSRPSRGRVAATDTVLEHDCRECSAEHCVREVNARRCEFGVCDRQAELEILLSQSLTPVRVCGLHVSPVLGWGVPEPVSTPVLRYLACRPESAA